MAARRTRKEAPMMRLVTFDRGLDPDPAVKVALEFGHAEVPGLAAGPATAASSSAVWAAG